MLPLTGLSEQANPALGSGSARRRSLTSFGMTNPLGVISSDSEKSFSTQKQAMILIQPLPCADNYAKQLVLTCSPKTRQEVGHGQRLVDNFQTRLSKVRGQNGRRVSRAPRRLCTDLDAAGGKIRAAAPPAPSTFTIIIFRRN